MESRREKKFPAYHTRMLIRESTPLLMICGCDVVGAAIYVAVIVGVFTTA